MSSAGSAATDPDSARLDAATRDAAVDEVATQVARHSLFPGVGAQAAAALRRRLRAGEYDAIADRAALADVLTRHLCAATQDQHYRVEYPAPPRPAAWLSAAPPGGPLNSAERAARRHEAALANFGVQRVERLAGNVGYLDVRHFYEADLAAEALMAAMHLVTHTGALILDLRRNGGGHPSGIILLCSYLLGPQPVHLWDIRWHDPGATECASGEPAERIESVWTLPDVPGRRFGTDRPIYILTSRQSFSGAEAVAFCLQNHGRATVVGERTRGGGHLASAISLDTGFGLSVPAARAVDPVTGTDLEGRGVVPDIGVSEAEALATAHAAALRHVLATCREPARDRALREEAARSLRELGRVG